MQKKNDEKEKLDKNVLNNQEKPRKKSSVGLIIFLSIVAIFMVIGAMVLPFVILLIIGVSIDGHSSFEYVNDNTIVIPDYNLTVEVTSEYYNEEDKCYVLVTKVDKKDADGDGVFLEADSLNVVYKFKDKDDYVLGETNLFIDNVLNDNKWKQRVYFCGDDATSVENYSVSGVYVE